MTATWCRGWRRRLGGLEAQGETGHEERRVRERLEENIGKDFPRYVFGVTKIFMKSGIPSFLRTPPGDGSRLPSSELIARSSWQPSQSVGWLQFAAAELKADSGVVLAAIEKNWRTVEFAAVELRANREVVLAAVAADWMALQFAAAELKADRDFVLAAIAENWQAFGFAAAELRADREVVLAAVAVDWTAAVRGC